MHLVSKTTMEAVLAIEVTDEDREDPRMIELILFFLWIGAVATNIASCVLLRRENMVSSSRHISTGKSALGRPDRRRTEPVYA